VSDKTLQVVSVETTAAANPRTGQQIIHINVGRDDDPASTVHHGLILNPPPEEARWPDKPRTEGEA